jgi:hypothetical protein
MTVATITTFLGCGQVFFSTGYVQAPTRLEFCTTVLSFRQYNPLSAARITALALLEIIDSQHESTACWNLHTEHYPVGL